MTLDDALRSLAAVQYSVVSRRQARALGVGTSGIRSRLLGPDWEAPTPRVLQLVGAPKSIRQRLMIAVLDSGPGTVLSHGAAAALWRLPGFPFGTLEISRPRRRSHCPSAVAVAHHPRLLLPAHVTERHGIPVTTLARTLFDLAGSLHPGRLDRLVETVVSKSPSVLPALRALLGELGAAGRDGTAAMRVVLAARPEGYIAAASGLEARFARVLADAGEPPLERQVDVGGHEWVGRVDFLDRVHRIVVEVDSDVHHTSPLDRAHDRRRDERLLEAGWIEVVRVSEDEVWRRPQVAVAKVRSARLRAHALPVAGNSPYGPVLATSSTAGGLEGG